MKPITNQQRETYERNVKRVIDNRHPLDVYRMYQAVKVAKGGGK